MDECKVGAVTLYYCGDYGGCSEDDDD
jgi:hypothetical protein